MIFDWSELRKVRHPAQVVSEHNLREGKVYTFVIADSKQICTDNRVFLGISIGACDTEVGLTSRLHTYMPQVGVYLGFSIHTDGWVGEACPGQTTPSMVYWDRRGLRSCSHWGYAFGLHDLLGPDYSPSSIEHRIVVPRTDWRRDGTMVCDFAGDIAVDGARLQCPDCKGTGVIMLLTSSVPCGCRASSLADETH